MSEGEFFTIIGDNASILADLDTNQNLSIGNIVIETGTGKVTYSGDVDDAAKEFWDAVEKYILGKI